MCPVGQSFKPVAPLCVLAFSLLIGVAEAEAQQDYGVSNESWNGLSHFVAEARPLGVQLEVATELDYASLGAETALIIIYPTVPLDREALVAYLRSGGRLLIADDYGTAGPLLDGLGVRRDTRPVVGGIHFRDEPHLPVAAPVSEDHVLTVGVHRLLTNHPATFITELPPVFVTGSPERPVIVVGAIGEGRLVMVGDPSIFINNMLEVRGNQQFARNLLSYLAGPDNARRVVLVTQRFGQRNGGGTIASDANEARQHFNIQLGRLSDWFASLRNADAMPPWISLVLVVLAICLIAVVIGQLRPRARLYTGKWLRPIAEERAAGFIGTLEYLKHPRATHLYPLMILKRVLEERLLDGLSLEAPARLPIVMEAYASREPNQARQKELERLLIRLSSLATSATNIEASTRISARELRRTFELARKLLKPLNRDIEVP